MFTTSAMGSKVGNAKSVIATLPARLNSFAEYDKPMSLEMEGRLLKVFFV